MARCTAPRNCHRTASGRANCPACGSRYGGYGGYGYGSYAPSRSYSSPSYLSSGSSGGGRSSGGSSGTRKARWSPAGSTIYYTDEQIRSLTPIRATVESRPPQPDRWDVFLCHAWDDRRGSAKELYDLLRALNVSVWFSETDIPLGTPFLREIDKGLAKSRVGIVLVTPSFITRIRSEVGIAEKELSALLARDQLVPIVHGTTYEALRDVSPLLGSRNGLSTSEESMATVAAKLAELVSVVVA